ncbi:hypothetical protein B0H13DRAFT_6144 [Mycena leptocephala]|nr:hypothetical protein B0H13DRAFT_6144 [Mycena leptocephala]
MIIRLRSDSSTVSRSSASGGSQSKGGPSQSTSSINPTILPGDQSSSPSTITMSEMSLTTVTAQSAQLAISHSKSNIGAIVGGVVGALMVVTLAILFIWLRSRKVIRVSPEKDPSARSQFLRIENYPMSNSLHPTDMHEVGVPLSSFKRYEGRMGGPSTTSLLTPSDVLSTPIPATPESSTLFRPPPETEPPAPSATSRDLRLMEERLATLEAQIAVHQHPPPYVNEDDE